MRRIKPCNEFYPGMATGIIEDGDLILTYPYDSQNEPKEGEQIEYKDETYLVIKTAFRRWNPPRTEIEVLLRKI